MESNQIENNISTFMIPENYKSYVSNLIKQSEYLKFEHHNQHLGNLINLNITVNNIQSGSNSNKLINVSIRINDQFNNQSNQDIKSPVNTEPLDERNNILPVENKYLPINSENNIVSFSKDINNNTLSYDQDIILSSNQYTESDLKQDIKTPLEKLAVISSDQNIIISSNIDIKTEPDIDMTGSLEKKKITFSDKKNEFNPACILEKLYDKIYIINLRHRIDRWERMTKIMKFIGINNYQRVDAIYGESEPIKKSWLYKRSTIRNYRVNSPGALGYLITYYHIICQAIINKYKNILVMDDDIVVNKDFNQVINTHFLPDNYDIIYYGASHQNHRNIDRINTPPKFINIKEYLRIYGNGNIDGSFMMGISSNVFSTLYYSIRNSLYPLDSGPLRDLYVKNPKNCYIYQPNLVIADLKDSDIQNGLNSNYGNYLSQQWGWNKKNYIF